MSSPRPQFKVFPRALEQAVRSLRACPMPVLVRGQLDGRVRACYRRSLLEHSDWKDLAEAVSAQLFPVDGAGYAILTGLEPESPDAMSPTERRLYTAIVSLLGSPFRVINRSDLWNPLKVDPEATPYRSSGTGYNNLHIDVPNGTKPPDLTCLTCWRRDPHGGGHTLISRFHPVLEALDENARAQLTRAQFVEGEFYEQENVGEELSPFPIVERVGDRIRFRFTGKLAYDQRNAANRSLIEDIENRLLAGADEFVLAEGDLLVANQWFVAHGRRPLGSGQEQLPSSERRLIYQCKLAFD